MWRAGPGAQSGEGAGGPAELHRARDPSRDQSYFLFATTAEQLDFLRFPLGDLEKAEVRRLAAHYDLPVAAKPDSQDICFVPNGSYAQVVEKLRPGALDAGEIVDLEGRVLGEHQGIINYTIGQRRGLGIGGTEEPLYVLRLEPAAKRVVVGPKIALARDLVRLGETNWLADPAEVAGRSLQVKLRSTTPAAEAWLELAGEGEGPQIRLACPQFGVSPGQAAVLYDGPRVLGGGWIREAAHSEPTVVPEAQPARQAAS